MAAKLVDEKGGMGEFEVIARLFAPLSRKFPGAHGLTDDCAYIPPRANQELVVTSDAIVEGVHFKVGTDPARIAQKLIRCNLSDLAAKGAVPFAMMLTAAFPKSTTTKWMTAFAEGLEADITQFGLSLIGGDTVSTAGPLVLSATLFGWCDVGKAPLRSGAKIGDVLWVSGSIGDSALGLNSDRWNLIEEAHRQFLLQRYELPEPRLTLGGLVAPFAHAAMDISDGLIQDCGHIANASKVGIEIEAAAIPLSKAARAVMNRHQIGLSDFVSGGDDYELLMAIPVEASAVIETLVRPLLVEFHPIGRIVEGRGVRVLTADGTEMDIGHGGWRHF